MIIRSVELSNFRNYSELCLEPDPGINIFCGDNAQGKTNILEAIYTGCTSRSHRAVKDREMIRFGCDESHIKLNLVRKDIPYRIDMHIKKNRSKGIAINGSAIRRASDLFGVANVIFFSPEDLSIIKNGPAERRKFLDAELCQLDKLYTHDLISYNRILNEKNTLLRESPGTEGYEEILGIYNEQLLKYGSGIIRARKDFIEKLNGIIQEIHANITAGRESVEILYECSTTPETFAEDLKKHRISEERNRMCLTGPHRDDLCFMINGIDIRHYGSQGQQRTAALSLKLSEIRVVEMVTGDRPVLLLDDVLSELDRSRQEQLLSYIGEIQTMISCTGLDDFVDKRFHIDKIFRVSGGTATGEN